MKKLNACRLKTGYFALCVLTNILSLFAIYPVCGQSVQELIAEGERNNPVIQAAELRYIIAGEKLNEVNSLPETEIGVGVFISEPETRTGAQKMRFSARQMLPWFGTISARENYAAAMADAEYEEVVISKRRLALQISQSYYQLFANSAFQMVLDKNIELLKTYERLALTSVEVGKTSAVDVLRLQIRQNDLAQRKLVLEEEFTASRVALNSLMNRKEGLALQLVDSLPLPETDLNMVNDSVALHPELIKYDRIYESILKAEALNLKEAGPKVGFGIDYVPVAERPGMDFSDNGKDIIMPMVSVSIPVFSNTYSSRSRQNELRQAEIASQKQERMNSLRTMMADASARRNAARIAYNTHGRNLERARYAQEILFRNYETGTVDFNDVLEIQELQLRFELNQIEAIRDYYSESARLNYITGN